MTTITTNPIAQLNDNFRKAPPNRDWFLTPGAKDRAVELLEAIAKFDDWGESNDPWKEHDFGSIEIENQKYFWKIDYFDLDREFGSEDPSNPSITCRVMTIMHCSEY
jgi:hypothetical protein